MIETPEERRDVVVAQIIAAGGMILQTAPLAHPDAPHEIVAYQVDASGDTEAIMEALAAIRGATETTLTGLVAWVPEEVATDEDSGD